MAKKTIKEETEITQENTKSTENDSIYSDLDEVDREIVKLILERKGIKNVEISKIIGMSAEMIGRRRNKFKVQRVLEQAQKPALDLLIEAQPMAARNIIKLSRSADERISLDASKQILKGVLSDNINIIGQLNTKNEMMNVPLDDEKKKKLLQELGLKNEKS